MTDQTRTIAPDPVAASSAPRRTLMGTAPGYQGLRATVVSTLLTVASLAALVAVGQATGKLIMIAPLAATAMIICATPGLPPAQPRGVVLGQIGSGALGLVAEALFGHTLWVAAVAAGLSVGLMAVLRAVHAPAAATAVLAVLQHPAAGQFLLLLAVGCVLLVAVGLVASRLGLIGRYPTYWW